MSLLIHRNFARKVHRCMMVCACSDMYSLHSLDFEFDVRDAPVLKNCVSDVRKIKAPAGKLGVHFVTGPNGVAAVHAVNSDSVLAGLIDVGDVVVAVDGVNTSLFDRDQIVHVIGSRQRHRRILSVSTPLLETHDLTSPRRISK